MHPNSSFLTLRSSFPRDSRRRAFRGTSFQTVACASMTIMRTAATVRTEFVRGGEVPPPPPAFGDPWAPVRYMVRRPKSRGRATTSAPAAAPPPPANEPWPLIVGTGDFPLPEVEVETEDDLSRPLTAYDELTRVVMRVNRILTAHDQHGKEGDEQADVPLTEAELELLHLGILDMLAAQERVASERKDLLREAVAHSNQEREASAGRDRDDVPAAGGTGSLEAAINQKASQAARLAALHESEVSMRYTCASLSLHGSNWPALCP